MIHRYNLFCLSSIGASASLLCLTLLWLANPFFYTWQLEELGRLLSSLAWVIFLVLGHFLLIAIFYYWWRGQVKQVFKSCVVTYRLRRFLHFESNDAVLDPQTGRLTPQKAVTRKANRSLWTIRLFYIETGAQLLLRLPANHESQEKVKELFPAIKTELQTIDPSLSFTDITNKKGRWYQAKGYRL